MANTSDVHIGKIVKNVFDASGMSVSELARRLHCERTNIYGIFQRRSIDVEMLAKLSMILNHNFFYDAMQLYGLSFKLNVCIPLDGLSAKKMYRLAEMLTELDKQP